MDFCLLLKIWAKILVKIYVKTEAVNIVRNFLIMLNNLLQVPDLKTASKRAIQKTAGATGDLIGNKIADKITKVSRTAPQNGSETVGSETKNTGFDRELTEERYISAEKKIENY